MHLVENLFVLTVTLLAVSLWIPTPGVASHLLLLAGAALALAVVACRRARWAQLPAALACATTAAAGYMADPGALSPWLSAAVLALALMSLLAICVLPVRAVPAPDGPYAVGVTEFMYEDDSRLEARSSQTPAPRTVYVKAWYPAQSGDGRLRQVSMWQELLDMAEFARLGRWLQHLRYMPTVARWSLPPASGQFPLLVYHHAIVAFPSENQLLMEALASHGYIVLSLHHTGQLAAFNRLRDTPTDPAHDARAIAAQLAACSDPATRAPVALGYFEAAVATNDLAHERVVDTEHLLAWLDGGISLPAQACELMSHADPLRRGVIGHSLGGAVATQLCKSTGLFAAGINLDGGQFGSRQREPLRVPFMAIANSTTPHWNDFLALNARADYVDCIIAGTRHGDFTDQGFVLPVLHIPGPPGRQPWAQVSRLNQTLLRAFLDTYVKQAAAVEWPQASPGVLEIRRQSPGDSASD